MTDTLKIVVISDTHGLHNNLLVPDGDVLIHAGDFTLRGELTEVEAFNEFLSVLPHQWKLVIAGNHDFCFQYQPQLAKEILSEACYLQDDSISIQGINFYGTPWQPWFMNFAFNLPRGVALREKWQQIPDNTDVLITHTPPYGVLDTVLDGSSVGCANLTEALKRVRPQLHVFGHIHESYGIEKNDSTTYVNACSCTAQYQATNPAIQFELPLNP